MKALFLYLFISFSTQAFSLVELGAGISFSNIDFTDKQNLADYSTFGVTTIGVEGSARIGLGSKFIIGLSGFYGGSNLDILYQSENENTKGQDASSKYSGLGSFIGFSLTENLSIYLDYYPQAMNKISWIQEKGSSILEKDDEFKGKAFGISFSYKPNILFTALSIRSFSVEEGTIGAVKYDKLPNDDFGNFNITQIAAVAGVRF